MNPNGTQDQKNEMISSELLAFFETTPLPGPEDSLMRSRYDTKYIFPDSRLPEILKRLATGYDISPYGKRLIQEYESVYFDDHRWTFYQDHQRGKLNRWKVRMRFYPASGFSCLEIKMKTNRNTTRKWRQRIPESRIESGSLSDDDRAFVKRKVQIPVEILIPRIRIRFKRLTLQRKDFPHERVTLDTELVYVNVETNATVRTDGFIIAEVKQVRSLPNSPFRRLMREYRIFPSRFSKYCYGVYLLHPDMRHNRFKSNYLSLERKKRIWRAAPFRESVPEPAQSEERHAPLV